MLNMAKTEILQIGSQTPREIPMDLRKYIKNQTKLLGIIFTKEKYEITNFANIAAKIAELAKWWKTRQLTLIGKVLITNTILLSQLWYVARVLTEMPKHIINEINFHIFKFIWNPSKIEPISRQTNTLPPIAGGLGVFDIKIRLDAYKLEKIAKILQTDVPKPWMSLYGYKHDFVLRREFHANMQSRTHKEILSRKDTQIHNLVTTFISCKPNANWDTLDLKAIYEVLQNSTKHTISIMQNYKAPKTWQNIFTALALEPIPHHLRDMNYRVLHKAVATRDYYKNKLHFSITDICRVCSSAKETITHILSECYPETYQALTELIGNSHTIDQLTIDTPPENKNSHMIYSIYRHMVICNHLKLNTPRQKTDLEVCYRLLTEIDKYIDYFTPP